MPTREGESFLGYLHRLAQDRGYIGKDVAPPADRPRPSRHGQPGFLERLESIFRRGRQPGEDDAETVGKSSVLRGEKEV